MSAPLTHYVSLTSTSPLPPFLTWETAATNIQDAVDMVEVADVVLVTNGLYSLGGRTAVGKRLNRVAVTKAATVRSINGPTQTTIQGQMWPNGSVPVRGVWLTAGACLDGFTVTNGYAASSLEGNVWIPVDGWAWWWRVWR